jgi:hypothetical protein
MVKKGMQEESALNVTGLETKASGTYVLPTAYHVLSLESM